MLNIEYVRFSVLNVLVNKILFLDALASLAFKLSQTYWLSEWVIVFQIFSLYSLYSFFSLLRIHSLRSLHDLHSRYNID